MSSAITGILTDKSMRSDQAVENSLLLHAKAGKAWGSNSVGS